MKHKPISACLTLIVAAFCAGLFAQEKSVKPGINDSWKSSDIQPLIERLEKESREIYHNRVDLAAVAGPFTGMTIADVGAGSGFMSMELARLIGPEGKVYAVDINPDMLKEVARRAREAGLSNLQTVVTGERSVDLPAASVDMVFVCDTYHHFEYPQSELASIHSILRPGGQLVVVEFHREEGKSPDWVLSHVRAGQEVFTREIEQAGFRLLNVHNLSFLPENYVLRFVRE